MLAMSAGDPREVVIHLDDVKQATDIDIELLEDRRQLKIGAVCVQLGCAVQSEEDLRCQFDRATKKLHIRFRAHSDQPAAAVMPANQPVSDEALAAAPEIQLQSDETTAVPEKELPLGHDVLVADRTHLPIPRGFESSYLADTNTAKGRGVFATEMLEPGSRVYAGLPIAAVAHDRYLNIVCASCLAELKSEQPVECPGCGVKYCSIECIGTTHADECKVLGLMKGGPFEKTIRGMRLFITLLQIRHENRIEFERRMSTLLDASHYGKLPDPDRAKYQTMAAGMIAKLKPLDMEWLEEASVTCDAFAELICLVHTNLHGICDFAGRFLGSGLYPEAALLNHSCSPNCVLSFVGSKIQVHTIAQVQAQAELFISYTELYALRSERQSALRDAKGFDCICSRCSCPDTETNLGRWMFEFDTIEWKRESEVRRWNMQISSAREVLRQANVSQCLAIVRQVLEEATPQLHPHHVTLYHARVMLVEVLQENPDAIAYSSELALNAEACAKAIEIELSPFHPTVAHMYQVVADSHQVEPGNAAAAYGKAAQRLAVAYGKTHPTVRELKKLREEALI